MVKQESNLSYTQRFKEATTLYSNGNYAEALELYDTLIRNFPEKVEPFFYSGLCSFAESDYIKALGYFLQASNLEAKNAEYYAWIGKSLSYAGHHNMAITKYKKALEVDENNLTALSGLGFLYTDKQIDSEAVKILTKAVSVKPSNSYNQANLALALARLSEYEKAIQHATKAIRLDPKNPDAYSALGTVHLVNGNHKEATQYFLKAIEINPIKGNAWYAIAAAKKFTTGDSELIKKMEHTLTQGMPSTVRQNLLFALAKVHDDLNHFEKAFPYAEKANTLVQSNYQPNTHRKKIKQIKNIFNKKYFEDKSAPLNEKNTPILIIGMPRSGSTLIDQILSTHSMVHSAGESTVLPDIIDDIGYKKDSRLSFPKCLQNLDKHEIEYYRDMYLTQTKQDSDDITHVVDKNLFNYLNLGLIATLLPNARIIHSQRHPLDTCLSCYMTNFAFTESTWTNNLMHIGKYYRDYVDLMNHWHKVLPIPILDVQYEDMITNTESSARRILEFCNLEWEANCLEFYKTKRGVNTASVWQVRQPVYKSSMHRWVPYAKHLQPLILALGDLLEKDYAQIESLGLSHGPRHNSISQKLSEFFSWR